MEYQEQAIKRRRQRALVILGIGFTVIILILLGYVIYTSAQFHIVDTDPTMDQFATYAPVLYVDFNEPLASDGLSVSSIPDITPSFSISGKRLSIVIDPSVQQGQAYTITLSNIRSTSGNVIAKYVFQFTGQYVPYDNLSTEMQNRLLKQQDHYIPSRRTITFINTDSLLNDGLSSAQLDAMEQAVFLFGQSKKTTISTVDIDESSVQALPHDPNSASVYFGLTFSATINGTAYNAQLQYANLTISRLILYNQQTNTKVYDSGNIDDNTLD